MQLATNFSLREFQRSQVAARNGIDNNLPENLLPQARRTAAAIQILRNALVADKKITGGITITSGYRAPKLNKKIGGSKKSQHVKAEAVDIVVPGMTPLEVFKFIASRPRLAKMFDQVILEFNEWVHISVSNDPRRQLIVASKRPLAFGSSKTVYEIYDERLHG